MKPNQLTNPYYPLLLFLALKIHCSQQCKELLDQLGGYEVEERGIVHLKVSFQNYHSALTAVHLR